MGATEVVASFVVHTGYQDLPSDVVDKAKRTALDTVAAALAGCVTPDSRAVVGYVKRLGGAPQAVVLGGGFRAPAPEAALANGTIAHAQDYDDCGMKIIHPSVKVLPVALALGEQVHASGQDVLAAYIVGLEIQGQIALHADFNSIERGLSSQCWYGSLGAAATAARMLGLNVIQTRMALGIAANLASGLFANHGTFLSPMAAGNAARNGVVAALMAREGVTASPDILEARHGFYDTLVGAGHYDLDRVVKGLGHPFFLTYPGVGLKRYPSCYHTHRAIEAVLQIMRENSLSYQDVAEVDVGTSEKALQIIAFSEPATPYQTKLSLPHCVAAAMVDGKITLDTFSQGKLEDPRIANARKKVHLSLPDLPIWPGLDALGPDTVFVGNPVTIRTSDGRSYSARVDTPRGDPAQPLTDQELLDKLADCARPVLTPEETGRLSHMMLDLDRVADICDVMDLLVKRPPGSRGWRDKV